MAPSSLNGFPVQEVDASAQGEGLLEAAVHTGELVIVGLVAGWLLAHLARRLRVHWGWPLLAAALLLLVVPVGSDAMRLLGSAVLGAAWARHRHARGVVGASPASPAPPPIGPAAVAALLCRLAIRRRRIGRSEGLRNGRLLVGYDRRAAPVEIELHGASGGRHALVLGAAGSGKSVTMTRIAVKAIVRGLPVVIVDPKDDPELRAQAIGTAASAGRRVIEFSPEGPACFNPLGSGSEGEIADKALAGETFTEPHYLRQAQRYIGHAVRALRATGDEVSLPRLAERLDPERLCALLRELPPERGAAGLAYVASLSARQRAELAGVRDRIALIAESDVGRWLDPRACAGSSFDLLSALRRRDVVLFRLRSDERPLLMQMLGGAIVLDLQAAAAALQAAPIPSLVVIDEFAALGARAIGGLFGRARGAGMSLVLGTQELTDLEVDGSSALRRQVTGNLTTLIAHRQANPESAEWVSRYAGEALDAVAGAGRRPAARRALAPDELRSLDVGCAAVIATAKRRGRTRLQARVARMLREPPSAPPISVSSSRRGRRAKPA